jgi:hypothetical protein
VIPATEPHLREGPCMTLASKSTMFTPAITASKVSPPELIISIAFLQACKPFALEMTIFLGLCVNAIGPDAAAAVSAADFSSSFLG